MRLLFLALFSLTAMVSSPAAMSFQGDSDIVVQPKGYGALEIGQVAHGYYKEGNLDPKEVSHIWQQRAFANIGFTARYHNRMEINIVGEGMMSFSVPQNKKYPETMQPRQFFYIKSSNAKIFIGNPDFLSGEIQAGYFPYKYNPDVRNLGEYLFRSNPYPTVIYADFDYPQANLLGLRLNFQGLNRTFSNDILLHSELIAFPAQNWSISDIAEVNLFRIASVGLGMSFYHYLNVYQGEYPPSSFEKNFYPDNLPASDRNSYSDTTFDNHRAIKAMGRLSLDVTQIFFTIFNKGEKWKYFNDSDGRIYGEIDLIGVEDFPQYYTSRADRLIYTFGFNIPGLIVLDLINFEFEYCNDKREFSDENLYTHDYPDWEPPSPGATVSALGLRDTIGRAPWRWSINIKKSLFNDHLTLKAQVARDHKRINFYYFDKTYMSFRETLPTTKDWWWTFKTEFKF